MSNEEIAPVVTSPGRPVMLLFMGQNEDHAITSFQKFFPASVHIITSDKFSGKYEKLLTTWSESYDFRRGKVCSVDDLFEPSAVNSLFSASFQALKDETENLDESQNPGPLFIGITGGTMHMAVTGTYLAQVIGGTVFYVLRPPDGQPVIPARDVVIFPELDSLQTALNTLTPDIHYLMSKSEGSVEEMFDDSNVNDLHLNRLVSQGLIEIDEGNWKVTELGKASFNFIAGSMIWQEFHMVLSNFNQSQDDDPNDPMHG